MKLLHAYWLIVVVLLLVMAFGAKRPNAANAWRKVLSPAVLHYLSSNIASVKPISWLLLSAAVVALALTSPANRKADEQSFQHATGWIAVADVSRSMTLTDVAPSRFTAMRDALATLTRAAGARPVALVIYSGDAFLAVPPVFDKTLLHEHIALLDYGIIDHDGSNLTRALSLTTSVINDSDFIRARVFVLSDGDGIGNSARAAARHLASSGHQVDMLLFGTQTDDPKTSTDINRAVTFATAGDGRLLHANRLGEIDLEELRLGSDIEATQNPDILALYWQNQSHWILLLLLPLALLWFRQDA